MKDTGRDKAASVRCHTLSETVSVKVGLFNYLLCQMLDLQHQFPPIEVSRVKTDAAQIRQWLIDRPEDRRSRV